LGNNSSREEFEGTAMTEQYATIALGKTDLQIVPLGIGAWAWGDKLVWGFGRGYSDNDVKEAFMTSIEAGINFYDTAEVYGSGKSERLLGSFLPQVSNAPVVATKFMPFPWRITKGRLIHALRASLKRLGLTQVDLYQIHWPFLPVPIETWADALADVVQEGLVKAVGVSNYDEAQMRRAYTVLARRGIPLASNQVDFSLANRSVEFDGLLKSCQELSITLIAYSPLAQGLLTGKYTLENPMPGIRGRKYNRATLEKAQPLLKQMVEIGRAHDGKTPSQVALNWLICKGTVPIPGAKNARQAQENAGALGWQLSSDEVAQLDEASLALRSIQ
jgi:aryl-alcohol dehydrogenase-like predicted oxidoreductase